MSRLLYFLVLLSATSAPAAQLGQPDMRDPEFARRFAASYGFLSSREPQVTEIEVAVLAKLAPLIAEAPDQAQTMIESMMTDGRPASAAFNHILGNIYFTNEQWDRAEAEYQEAIRKFPDFQRAWNSLGTLLMQRDRHRAAAAALSRSVELGASDTQTFGMLGYALLQAREYVAAEIAYNMALLRAPDNVRWLEGKARILAESGRHEETIAATDELLRKNPGNVEYWRLQANACLALGQEKETARNLEIARSLGTLDANALYLLGNLYLKQGMPEHALDALLAAIKLLPKPDPATILRVAQSLLGQDQVELARRLLATLGETSEGWADKDRVLLSLLQGRIALHDQNTEAAVAAFSRALDVNPLSAEALYRLALVHADQEQTDKARYLLEKIRGEPTYEYGAQLFLAKMLVQETRYEAALGHLRQALRLKPSIEIENLYNRVRVAAQSTAN